MGKHISWVTFNLLRLHLEENVKINFNAVSKYGFCRFLFEVMKYISEFIFAEEASKRSSMMHDFEKLYSHAMQLQVQVRLFIYTLEESD